MSNIGSAERRLAYDRPGGFWTLLQDVKEHLKRMSRAYIRPLEVAKELGITRPEAELALRYWREAKVLAHRERDGRWYYDNTEPWRLSA